jgi:hypothetical protein
MKFSDNKEFNEEKVEKEESDLTSLASELNEHRNEFNQCPSHEPQLVTTPSGEEVYMDAKGIQWDSRYDIQEVFHDGEVYNSPSGLVHAGFNGEHECTYDEQGNFISNDGTYNYSETGTIGHIAVDVIPHVIGENPEEDSTTLYDSNLSANEFDHSSPSSNSESDSSSDTSSSSDVDF